MRERRTGLLVAIVATVIGVPLLLFYDRRPDAAQPPTSTVVPFPDVLGTTPLAFDEVTVPPSAPGPPVIVVPDIPAGIPMPATFSSSIRSARECAIGSVDVPFGIAVNIRNVDNDRSIRCNNSIQSTVDQLGIVVLPLAAYEKIADVTDAPIHVEITW